jgi:hypothetical protein
VFTPPHFFGKYFSETGEIGTWKQLMCSKSRNVRLQMYTYMPFLFACQLRKLAPIMSSEILYKILATSIGYFKVEA